MAQEASSKAASDSSILKIGELARRTGKTNRTLHFYEELGLLVPARRTKGGFRLYSEHAVLRIRWIERLQELGFTLQEIVAFLSDLTAEDTGPGSMARLRDFYQAKAVETRATLVRLAALQKDLELSLMYLDGCKSCDPLTHRTACHECGEATHEGVSVPDMVAAVHLQN
jgi:DNA-binding transcriptional MerR regulator